MNWHKYNRNTVYGNAYVATHLHKHMISGSLWSNALQFNTRHVRRLVNSVARIFEALYLIWGTLATLKTAERDKCCLIALIVHFDASHISSAERQLWGRPSRTAGPLPDAYPVSHCWKNRALSITYTDSTSDWFVRGFESLSRYWYLIPFLYPVTVANVNWCWWNSLQWKNIQ